MRVTKSERADDTILLALMLRACMGVACMGGSKGEGGAEGHGQPVRCLDPTAPNELFLDE